MVFIIPLQVWMLLLGLVTLAYRYIQYQSSFWARRGVRFKKPHWLLGNYGSWTDGDISAAENLVDIYREFRTEKFCGTWSYRTPTLFAIDLDVIRHILVKDYDTWSSRGLAFNAESDPLSATLVNLDGKAWKSVRTKLSPGFTPGKLKQMYYQMLECGKEFEKYLLTLAANGGLVEAKEMSARFLTDVNCVCVLGINMNTLNGHNPLYDQLKAHFLEMTFWRRMHEKVSFALQIGFPRLFKLLNLRMQSQELTDAFVAIVKQTFKYREKNDVQRNDFLDLLRSLKNTGKPLGKDELEFDDKLLAAQAFDFFLGSFESGCVSVNYCLHELAVNKDIQDRLRKEVHATKAAGNGEISWDAMNQMKYLDMVVQETLRKYPAASTVLRRSVKPYRIPDTDVELPSGTLCVIPAYAIQRDPEHYPDPDKFDPERFAREATSPRQALTFLSFGAGPRNCIGLRLGEIELKVAVMTVVDKFEISLSEKTKHPPEFEPGSIFLNSKGGTWIQVSKRSFN